MYVEETLTVYLGHATHSKYCGIYASLRCAYQYE